MVLNLKIFTVLVILTIVAYSNQQQNDPAFMQQYLTISTDCAQQNGYTEDQIDQLWKGTSFPDDPKLKCYFDCINTKLGVMDANGNIVQDLLTKVAGEFYNVTIDGDITKNCDVKSQTDRCETAFALMSCVMKTQ